ncbi:helix-turn-helix transcriptional regulator [Roseicyclus mahoneyensis]|jgi:DNA-binding CsgD family transcriptional regulator|uniref:DNA-binding CsgD family transcriptional regulator n=1 Tax=Roseicyclus mahoneyensis TaxID=164332 RepID=A0A316GL53_9RHOB|nr:helix-turn-helix transcriptional regulator [Roseicyclus mahoneyensis]PWK61346.1 DNA-binding CsgD family transcriptional regulator [Roseicyclus mahoneyensis]
MQTATHVERPPFPVQDLAEATTALIVIDETLRLISADPAGHALLMRDNCLRLSLGHICTGSHNRNMRLKECITSGGTGGSLDLGDGVVLTLTPLRAADGMNTTRQAILMARVTEVEEDAVSLVSESCGLTKAESEVLRLIYKGFSTVEAARISGVAKSTVRSHLQRVFAKTDTSRQSELVHFVATWRG